MSYIGKIKIGATGTELSVGSTLYGAATAPASGTVQYTANSGNLANVDTLITGLTVHIKFAASNTYTNPTLKVGSCDAKQIQRIAGTAVGTTEVTSWPAGAVVALTYDGSAWVINSSTDINTDTTYTFAEGSTDGAFSVTPSGGSAQTVNVHNVLKKTGDTMTGALTLNTAPTDASHAVTKKYVDDAISDVLGAADAMVFKGTLGAAAQSPNYTTVPNGTASDNPALDQTYQAGWTYKIVTAGTYAGHTCEVGDLLIAIHDSTNGQSSINSDHWTVAQGNLDGAVTTSNGADGWLTKFTGTHTIGKLVQLSSAIAANAQTTSTKFLREDGTWAVPSYTESKLIAGGSSATSNAAVTSGNVYLRLFDNTTNRSNLQLSGTNGIKITSANTGIITFEHSNSITAKTANTGSTATLDWGGTFTIYEHKYDGQGHITETTNHTITMPANPNTDTKVKQNAYSTSTNYDFDILFKKTNNHNTETDEVNYSTVSGNTLQFNPSTGTLKAAVFQGTLHKDVLGTDSTVTTALTFYHKSGAWKTLSIPTIASIANGVLTINNVALSMT